MLYTQKKAYSIEFFNCCKNTTGLKKSCRFVQKLRNINKKSLKITHY